MEVKCVTNNFRVTKNVDGKCKGDYVNYPENVAVPHYMQTK